MADTLLYRKAQSAYFAKGGIGLNIPLSKHVELFGAANVLYTINDNNTEVADLRSVFELNTHTMFNFGVRLKLGKSVRTNTHLELKEARSTSEEYSRMNDRIQELEEQLTAKKTADIEKAEVVPMNKESDKEASKGDTKEQVAEKASKVALSPAELENLIDKVVKGVESEESYDVQKRLNRLEYLLLQMNPGTYYPGNYTPENSTIDSRVNDKLLLEIKRLNDKIELQDRKINEISGSK